MGLNLLRSFPRPPLTRRHIMSKIQLTILKEVAMATCDRCERSGLVVNLVVSDQGCVCTDDKNCELACYGLIPR